MKKILYFLIITLIISCKQKEQTEDMIELNTPVLKTKTVDKIILKNFTYEDISRYAIASIMGQSAKIIKVTKKDEIYILSYIRKSDKQKFDYKMKVEGNKILWANLDGRWRNSEYDEKITFIEKENNINIIQTFEDNSQDIQEFIKGD
ncbi:hypothetical protein [Flavobacterium sp.]|uniref:hypothetical protein n=1 Tax=Flavobacterium sp. TaxID=239 RepID=UPI00326618DC